MSYLTITIIKENEIDLNDVLETVKTNSNSLIDFNSKVNDRYIQVKIKVDDKSTDLLKALQNKGYKASEALPAVHSEKEIEKFIITVISRSISAEQLQATNKLLNDNKLSILSVKRLSGEHETVSANKCCYEFLTVGEADKLESLRSELKTSGEQIGLDICINSKSFARNQIKLAVFDMDSTLIQCECIDELAKRCGIGEKVSEITASAMRGEIDFTESFTRRMALLEGLDESVLKEIAANLPLTEGVVYLMKSLKKLGFKTALFSGGFYYFANHLKKLLDIDYVYANELPIVDGKVTGKVSGEIVDGQKKKEKLIEIAEKENLDLSQTVCVGDGANDLPMIGTAGMGVAFHAKPLVREEAPHAVSSIGLDGLLYLLGISDDELITSI